VRLHREVEDEVKLAIPVQRLLLKGVARPRGGKAASHAALQNV